MQRGDNAGHRRLQCTHILRVSFNLPASSAVEHSRGTFGQSCAPAGWAADQGDELVIDVQGPASEAFFPAGINMAAKRIIEFSIQLDLDSSESIRQAVEQSIDLCDGRLDAVFNNGAFGLPGAVEDLTRNVLRAQFETNVFGTQELTNLVIPAMRRQAEGRIIQNSLVLGFVSLPYRGAYVASKFALEGLTDTLRLELRGTDIHVSLVQPGPITSRFRPNAYLAYQRNIDPVVSVHRERYEGMEQRLKKAGPVVPFTLPPEAVLKKVIHALESPRPKARYCVTFPTYLFATLKRILPDLSTDEEFVRMFLDEAQQRLLRRHRAVTCCARPTSCRRAATCMASTRSGCRACSRCARAQAPAPPGVRRRRTCATAPRTPP